MAEIRTLVYFDLEATGLKSSGTPRVCEISLLAVNTKDVLDLHVTLMDHLKNRKTEETLFQVESLFPRVMNNLTLCVYPMATIIPFVSSMTGLDNYNLTGQSNFDKDIGHLLNMFLARLPSPVCLVAHNGNLYDFPLLKAEMEKAGTKLGSQILCADSYIGLKEIFKKRKEINEAEVAKKKEIERTDERKYIKSELEAVTELLNAGEYETEMKEEKCDKANAEVQRKRKSQESTNSSEDLKISKVKKLEDELTPSRTGIMMASNFKPRKIKHLSCSENMKHRKKLIFSITSMPTSFSLINLHKHLLGCPPAQSHGAEADCLELLRTTAVLGREWLEWVQDNCFMFENCKAMWGIAGKSKSVG
jgi:DNA polymerase III epsilon subunit-like protein